VRLQQRGWRATPSSGERSRRPQSQPKAAVAAPGREPQPNTASRSRTPRAAAERRELQPSSSCNRTPQWQLNAAEQPNAAERRNAAMPFGPSAVGALSPLLVASARGSPASAISWHGRRSVSRSLAVTPRSRSSLSGERAPPPLRETLVPVIARHDRELAVQTIRRSFRRGGSMREVARGASIAVAAYLRLRMNFHVKDRSNQSPTWGTQCVRPQQSASSRSRVARATPSSGA
jgi:hypothetical protein